MTVMLIWLLAWVAGLAQTGPRARVVESIVPWLVGTSACTSTVEIRNLGSRDVSAEVEGHTDGGALVPLGGQRAIQVGFKAGEQVKYAVNSPGDGGEVWVRVREKIASPELSPVLVVRGTMECLAGDTLRTEVREGVRSGVDPWFSDTVAEGDERTIGMINNSERQARVRGCYSAGVFYAVPDNERASQLTPVCSETIDEMVPAFGSRRFRLWRDGNSNFSVKTWGNGVVLQILRPAGGSVRAYRVESTVTFGKEVPH